MLAMLLRNIGTKKKKKKRGEGEKEERKGKYLPLLHPYWILLVVGN